MLHLVTEVPIRVINKWNQYFNYDLNMEDWINSFQCIYQSTNFIDLHEFHFKMLHRTLANNED
jgi:hypothetical protein